MESRGDETGAVASHSGSSTASFADIKSNSTEGLVKGNKSPRSSYDSLGFFAKDGEYSEYVDMSVLNKILETPKQIVEKIEKSIDVESIMATIIELFRAIESNKFSYDQTYIMDVFGKVLQELNSYENELLSQMVLTLMQMVADCCRMESFVSQNSDVRLEFLSDNPDKIRISLTSLSGGSKVIFETDNIANKTALYSTYAQYFEGKLSAINARRVFKETSEGNRKEPGMLDAILACLPCFGSSDKGK